MTKYNKQRSNAFIALEQSEEYTYTQTKVKAVVNALKINQDRYRPEMTIEYVEEFCKDERFTGRFFYSDISGFIFKLGDEAEVITANANYLMRYAYKNKGDITENCFNFIIRLYDHIQLAIVQNELINNSFDNKIETTKEKIQTDTRKIERHYIAILGIFAAVVITFVGELAFSTSVLENIDACNYKYTLSGAIIIGLVFVNGLFGLFLFISKIIGIDIKLEKWRWIWATVNAIIVATGISLIFMLK